MERGGLVFEEGFFLMLMWIQLLKAIDGGLALDSFLRWCACK